MVPGENQAEGEFYSAGNLKALLKRSTSDGEWDYFLVNVSKGALNMGYRHWNGMVSWERRS